MDISIREYDKKEDFSIIQVLIEKLLDYLVEIDSMKRLRRGEGYGKSYTERFIKRVEEGNGMIYLAEADGEVIGLIGGIIEKQTPEDLLECVPSKPGRVIELVVDEKYRGRNVGLLLIQKMEEYFLQNGRDTLRIEVLSCNNVAHNFYEKNGYQDRMVDMIKLIK